MNAEILMAVAALCFRVGGDPLFTDTREVSKCQAELIACVRLRTTFFAAYALADCVLERNGKKK